MFNSRSNDIGGKPSLQKAQVVKYKSVKFDWGVAEPGKKTAARALGKYQGAIVPVKNLNAMKYLPARAVQELFVKFDGKRDVVAVSKLPLPNQKFLIIGASDNAPTLKSETPRKVV